MKGPPFKNMKNELANTAFTGISIIYTNLTGQQ